MKRTKPATAKMVRSSPFISALRLKPWRTFYIIDPRGVIRYKWAGAPPGEKAIDAALEKLIQEAERDAKMSPE